MNDFLKYAIYFLLGIILYYFLFNSPKGRKLIEGFDDTVKASALEEDGIRLWLDPVTLDLVNKYPLTAGGKVITLSENVTFKSGVNYHFKITEDGRYKVPIPLPYKTDFKDSGNENSSIFPYTIIATLINLQTGDEQTGDEPNVDEHEVILTRTYDNLQSLAAIIGVNEVIDFLPALADPINEESDTGKYNKEIIDDLTDNFTIDDNDLFYVSETDDVSILIRFSEPLDSNITSRLNNEVDIYFILTINADKKYEVSEVVDDTLEPTVVSEYDFSGTRGVVIKPASGIMKIIFKKTLAHIGVLSKDYEGTGIDAGTKVEGNEIMLTQPPAGNSIKISSLVLVKQSILKLLTYPTATRSGGEGAIRTSASFEGPLPNFIQWIQKYHKLIIESIPVAGDQTRAGLFVHMRMIGKGENGDYGILGGCSHSQICADFDEDNSHIPGSHWALKTGTNAGELFNSCNPLGDGDDLFGQGAQACDLETCCENKSCAARYFTSGTPRCSGRIKKPWAKCDASTVEDCSVSCCGAPVTGFMEKLFNNIMDLRDKIRGISTGDFGIEGDPYNAGVSPKTISEDSGYFSGTHIKLRDMRNYIYNNLLDIHSMRTNNARMRDGPFIEGDSTGITTITSVEDQLLTYNEYNKLELYLNTLKPFTLLTLEKIKLSPNLESYLRAVVETADSVDSTLFLVQQLDTDAPPEDGEDLVNLGLKHDIRGALTHLGTRFTRTMEKATDQGRLDQAPPAGAAGEAAPGIVPIDLISKIKISIIMLGDEPDNEQLNAFDAFAIVREGEGIDYSLDLSEFQARF